MDIQKALRPLAAKLLGCKLLRTLFKIGSKNNKVLCDHLHYASLVVLEIPRTKKNI